RKNDTGQHYSRLRYQGRNEGWGGSPSYSGCYQQPAATAFSTSAISQGAISYPHSAADYGQADTRKPQSFTGMYNPKATMYNVQQAAGSPLRQ
ncbi:hypothetical protein V8F06_009158, partial [Rhypophila decipiens]